MTRLVSVLLCAALAALTVACGSDPAEPVPAGSGSTGSGSAGDAAVWVLGPDPRLAPSAATFTALVSRLGCNDGVTGEVLPPEIQRSGTEVVVTFRVRPKQDGAASCPSNNDVAFDVDLGEPLGDRALVDGACLPGGAAVTTASCVDGPTRFRP